MEILESEKFFSLSSKILILVFGLYQLQKSNQGFFFFHFDYCYWFPFFTKCMFCNGARNFRDLLLCIQICLVNYCFNELSWNIMVKITHHTCFIFNCKLHARIAYEGRYSWMRIIFRKPCSWGNIYLSAARAWY